MIEVTKLLEYAKAAGHPMWKDADKLMVRNGKNLSPILREQIIIHKHEILEYLKGQSIE